MPVPNTFANATTTIPLSDLDNNFATAITIGNTAVQLGNTVTTLNNMTFANVTISSVASTFPNSYFANNAVTIGNTSVSLGSTQTTFGNVTLNNATIASGNVTITDATIANSVVISGNTAGNLVRITQTGAGNALVVEDSANPDATPFVVDASGRLLMGQTSVSLNAGIQITSDGTSAPNSNIASVRRSSDVTGTALVLQKSRGTLASPSIVSSGDALGDIQTYGYDGANMVLSTLIRSEVDGTPGTNDMPGRLVFSTTADGASTVTERMRIGSDGGVGIGGANIAGFKVSNYGTVSGATSAYSYYSGSVFQSDVTTSGIGFGTFLGTQATSFTLSGLSHLRASQGTFGAGSTVTNQYGFEATSNLTGATNNFGFHSNIASGTGRWNFYANGTAGNYFAGSLGIGSTTVAGYKLRLGGTFESSGNEANPLFISGTADTSSTSAINGVYTQLSTADGITGVTNLRHFYAVQGTITGGTRVAPTNQFGFFAHSGLTGATNNYGFYSDIASGTGRWNFFANGTANNAFAGSSQFGAVTAPTALVTIAAGTATANTAPLKFTSGVNLTTPEAGVVEYDGTILTATTNTNFKRGTIPITNYASGTGTTLGTNTEATLQNLLPAANDTITLSAGTYFVDTSFIVTRGSSTTSATARLNILGSGGAAGSFSGMSLSAPTAGGATANFSFDAVNINTSNVLTAASVTSAGVYTMNVQGILKITTGGTIVPQYNLSANINGAGTVAKVLYFRLQQVDTQSAAAFGPAGTGWG